MSQPIQNLNEDNNLIRGTPQIDNNIKRLQKGI